jgi:hypothetical protein
VGLTCGPTCWRNGTPRSQARAAVTGNAGPVRQSQREEHAWFMWAAGVGEVGWSGKMAQGPKRWFPLFFSIFLFIFSFLFYINSYFEFKSKLRFKSLICTSKDST